MYNSRNIFLFILIFFVLVFVISCYLYTQNNKFEKFTNITSIPTTPTLIQDNSLSKFSPTMDSYGLSFHMDTNSEVISLGCIYIKSNDKYLAFSSTQNKSHVYLTNRTPLDIPPKGENPIYTDFNYNNIFKNTVKINLDEPQKWIAEKSLHNNDVLIRTLNKPYFYLASDCDGNVFTTLNKNSSNQLWTFIFFGCDEFNIKSVKYNRYLSFQQRGRYLFNKLGNKVYTSKNHNNNIIWNIIPCEPGNFKVTSVGKCSSTCGPGRKKRTIKCIKKGKVVDPFECIASKKIPEYEPCVNYSGCVPFWETGMWGDCDTKCGYGLKTKNTRCVYKLNNGKIIDSTNDGPYCKSTPPKVTEKCLGTIGCKAGWRTGSYGKCNTTCGIGYQTRNVECDYDLPNNVYLKTMGKNCDPSKRPNNKKECKEDSSCKRYWKAEEWSKCPDVCGTGTQTRIVNCYMGFNGTEKKIADSLCTDIKPITSKTCTNYVNCKETVGNWSKCSSSCGYGYQTRKVECKNNLGQIIDNINCPTINSVTKTKKCHDLSGCNGRTPCAPPPNPGTKISLDVVFSQDCTGSFYGLLSDIKNQNLIRNVCNLINKDFPGSTFGVGAFTDQYSYIIQNLTTDINLITSAYNKLPGTLQDNNCDGGPESGFTNIFEICTSNNIGWRPNKNVRRIIIQLSDHPQKLTGDGNRVCGSNPPAPTFNELKNTIKSANVWPVFALSNKWVSNIDDWYKDIINRLKTGSYVPLSFNSSAFTNSIINAIGVATGNPKYCS